MDISSPSSATEAPPANLGTPAPRHGPRIPPRVETRRPDGGRARFLGYVANISATGAFVQCSLPREEGTPLALRVHLGNKPDQTIELEARVVWIRGYAGRNRPSAGMGLEFCDVDKQVRKAIRAFCKRREG